VLCLSTDSKVTSNHMASRSIIYKSTLLILGLPTTMFKASIYTWYIDWMHFQQRVSYKRWSFWYLTRYCQISDNLDIVEFKLEVYGYFLLSLLHMWIVMYVRRAFFQIQILQYSQVLSMDYLLAEKWRSLLSISTAYDRYAYIWNSRIDSQGRAYL